MHEPLIPAQREALAGVAGAAARLIQGWAETNEQGQHDLLEGLGRSMQQLDAADAAAERPEWCALEVHNTSRGLSALPPIEDQHGQLPTGYTRVRESSAAVHGAMWVDAATYGDDLEPRLNREVQRGVALHYRGWQARRLAYQLLAMAEHVDPNGGTEPPDAGGET